MSQATQASSNPIVGFVAQKRESSLNILYWQQWQWTVSTVHAYWWMCGSKTMHFIFNLKNNQLSLAMDHFTKDFHSGDKKEYKYMCLDQKTGPPTAQLIKKSSDGRQPWITTFCLCRLLTNAIKLGLWSTMIFTKLWLNFLWPQFFSAQCSNNDFKRTLKLSNHSWMPSTQHST